MIIAAVVAPNSYPIPVGGQHITLAYMGGDETDAAVPDADVVQLLEACTSVASHTTSFSVEVTEAGELGDAYVVHVDGAKLSELRDELRGHDTVANMMDAVEQFPEYTPHMTVAYKEDSPTAPAVDTAEPLHIIGLALWVNGMQLIHPFNTPMTAAAGVWNPLLHPRGKDGKFINKFGIVKFLSMITGGWEYGKVVGLDYAPGTKKEMVTVRPSNLAGTPNGKADIDLPPSKVYSAPPVKAYIPAKDMKKIGGQAGSNPGGLYEAPHKPGAPVMVSGADMIADPDTYIGQTFKTVPKVKGATAIEGKITKMTNGELAIMDDEEFLYISPDTTLEGLAPAFAAGDKLSGAELAAQYEASPESFNGAKVSVPSKNAEHVGETFSGPVTFSNDMIGVDTPDGFVPIWDHEEVTVDIPTPAAEKFYVKKAKTASHGHNEALANALYEEAGVYVPEVSYDATDGNLYSKIVEGKEDMSARLANKDTEWLTKVQANFAVDAWLSNRDVFGMTFDNIITDEYGEPVRIDNGGALLYRAQGTQKIDFHGTVTELDSFRMGKKAQVFGPEVMSKETELDGAQRVLAISPERITELVAEHHLPKSLADTLKARRKYIADYYGLPLPETMQPSGAEHTTVAPLVDPWDVLYSGGRSRKWTPTWVPSDSLDLIWEAGDTLSGEPPQLKKATMGKRPQHKMKLSAAQASQLLDYDWERGDRLNINGDLLDVIGMHRENGTMLVSTPGSVSPFTLNAYNLPHDADIEVSRWDPEAASDVLPEPSKKTGMAVPIENALKADLVQPLPSKDSVKAVPDKKMVLGDGTEATTGAKLVSKIDGKEYIFVKPKGPYAVVTNPNAEDPGKTYLKKASTMTQPGAAPMAEVAKPKSKNGVEPQLGMVALAKDGTQGPITMISPDGAYVFIDTGATKPKRKSTTAVDILLDKAIEVPTPTIPEPLVAPGVPDPGTPGIPGHTYGIAGKKLWFTPEALKSKEDLTPASLVYVATPDGGYSIEQWANQPQDALFTYGGKVAVHSDHLGLVAIQSHIGTLPPLGGDPYKGWRVIWSGKEYQIGANNPTTPLGTVAMDTKGNWVLLPYGSPVIVWATGYGIDTPPAGIDPPLVGAPYSGWGGMDAEMASLKDLSALGEIQSGMWLTPNGVDHYQVVNPNSLGAVLLESSVGEQLALQKDSPVMFAVSGAPEVIATPEPADMATYDVVKTAAGETLMKLPDGGWLWSAGEQTSYLPEEDITPLGNADEGTQALTPSMILTLANTKPLVLSTDSNTYTTHGNVGKDGILVQNGDGVWSVLSKLDLVTENPTVKVGDGGLESWPLEASQVVAAHFAEPWVTSTDFAPGGVFSAEKLVSIAGPDVLSSVFPVYYLPKYSGYYRLNKDNDLEHWDADGWTVDTGDAAPNDLGHGVLVVPGVDIPELNLNLYSGGNITAVAVKPKHTFPIFNLVDPNGEAAYKVGDQFVTVGPDGDFGDMTWHETKVSDTYLVWDPEATVATQEGGQLFSPTDADPFQSPLDAKVVEFESWTQKAYAVQTEPGGPWTVHGSKELPTTMSDASINAALAKNSGVMSAKVVYTGPEYGGAKEAPGAWSVGAYTAPEGARVYMWNNSTGGPSYYFVKQPDGTKWDVVSMQGSLTLTFNTDFVKKQFGIPNSAAHVHGPDLHDDSEVATPTPAPTPAPTPTFNGYTPADGESVIKMASGKYYVQSADKSWSYLTSEGKTYSSTIDETFKHQGYKVVYGNPDLGPTPDTSTGSVLIDSNSTGIKLDGSQLTPEETTLLSKVGPFPPGTQIYTKASDQDFNGATVVGTYTPGHTEAQVWTVGNNSNVVAGKILTTSEWSGLPLFSASNSLKLDTIATPPATVPKVPDDFEAGTLADYTPVHSMSDLQAGDIIHLGNDIALKLDEAPDSGGNITTSKKYYLSTGVTEEFDSPSTIWMWASVQAGEISVKKGVSVPDATPKVPESIPGVTPADPEAAAAWGGALTKTGHVPYPGMAVTGKGPMAGKIISVSKDKTKATVLTNDGKKTTRLISTLKANTSANYAAHLGPVEPVDIPEGMEVPYDNPQTVLKKAFEDTQYIGGIVNSHEGIKHATTTVKSVKAPNGKTYARASFVMTVEQRAKFMAMLQGEGPAQEFGVYKPASTKALSSLEPGDAVSLRYSNSQGEWVADKNATKAPTHKLVSVDNGVWTFANVDNPNDIITTPFTKKASSSGVEYTVMTYNWDPDAVKPLVASSDFQGLSAEMAAKGWQWSNAAVISSAHASNGTVSSVPGTGAPSGGELGGPKKGAYITLADGTAIEVNAPQAGHDSTQGTVVISIPEGGDPTAAYGAAMEALGMSHKPMTQNNVKAQVRPILNNMLSLNKPDPNATPLMTDEQMFTKIGAAVGVPDIGWQDVRVGVQPEQGRTEFFWSQRVIDAMAAKSSWDVVVRGGKSYTKVIDVVKYGAIDAQTRRVLGFPGAGNGHGTDSSNNAGDGSFMSGGVAGKFSTSNIIHPPYGGGYSVYHSPTAVFARITDIRPGHLNADVYGSGQGNGSSAFAGMLNQSKSGDLWMTGGMPVDTIGYIVMNNAMERDHVIDELKKAGITQVNGRLLEEVIQTAADLNKLGLHGTVNIPYTPQGTVDLSTLPEG